MSTHIGKDFTPPCVPGKVTGEIKYAEDYKAEGMVFARLLTSPMPSGRVVNIDASAALRMDGVIGILLPMISHLSRPRPIRLWHRITLPMSVNRFWQWRPLLKKSPKLRLTAFELISSAGISSSTLWRVSLPMVRMPIPKATRW